MPPDALPGLQAVLEPEAPRSETFRLRLRRRELEQLRRFAAAAAIPSATLAHALLSAGLNQLVQAEAMQTLHNQQEAA
jgi:hypothetical protein